MGRLSKALVSLLVLVLSFGLASCGGDNAFETPGSGTNGTTGSSQVASIILLASSPNLGSANTSAVTLTAQVKDANNALMEGESVIFSATGGGLLVNSNTTNTSGVATATLSTAGDPTNRSITVTATAGGVSDSVTINVTGSSVSVSGEGSVVFGNSITLTVFVKDSDGNGVPSQAVSVASANGNTLSAASLTTGSSGDAQVTFTGTASGTDTITVSALNATATYSVSVSSDEFDVALLTAGDLDIGVDHTIEATWLQSGSPVADNKVINFSTTRGTLSATSALTSGGTGTASVTVRSDSAGPVLVTAYTTAGPSDTVSANFVATTPASITAQPARETMGPDGQENVVTAVVRDASGNLVKNVPVRFTIVEDKSGGSISNSTDVTDAQGRASTKYTSSQDTTRKDGVVIRADIQGTALSDTVYITVAQSSLFVRLGTGNEIEKLDFTRYRIQYAVLVTDAGGNAAPNTNVTVTLIPTTYYKGVRRLVDSATGSPVAPWNSYTGTPIAPWSAYATVGCQNEDTLIPTSALNGLVDVGEDINGNGTLDPGNVASVQGTVTTDETGFGIIDIIYAKDYADWVDVKLRASAQVAGSEGYDEVEFNLPVAASDVGNAGTAPPGEVSPFGDGYNTQTSSWTNTCSDAH